MKICYLANARTFYFARWYDFFIKRGHEVHVISGDDSFVNLPIQLPQGVKLHYLPEKKLPNRIISFAYNFLRLPIILKGLNTLIKQISPDIIHAHQINPYGFWAALSNFQPFIMTPIGSDVLIFARQYKLYKLITRYVLKKANLITSDSYVLLDAIFESGREIRAKCHLIQNGVDLRVFNPGVDKNYIRSKHDLKEGPIILSPRDISSIYNIDCIVNAIPKVVKTFPHAQFICLYYSTDMVEEMKRLTYEIGISSSAKFKRYVLYEQMPLYDAGSDVCVSVPSSDSSPCSVYEAMACGTPVIVSDLPWTKHFIRNRENALVVPVRSSEAIADAILEILWDETLRSKLIDGGLSTVKKYVDYYKNMEMMEALMLNTLDNKEAFR